MIDIGSQKQLFLDDYLIETVTGVKRTLNPATKAPNNPVIHPDQPWEGNNLHYGCVFYDNEQRLFRMWYTASTVTPSEAVRLFTQPDAGLTQTGVANQATWRGNGDLHALQGEYVKLKFYLKNAKLFAFQFIEERFQ